MLCQRILSLAGVLLWSHAQLVSATNAPFIEQSFFFDWNVPGQPYPIAVTQQCETIHITWGRGTATGPNPVSPYYLQVYTSTSLVPFIISVGDVLQYDWQVPFAPGTQYQICMFDKNGNTGGCQDVYTMIPGSNSSSPPSCTNVTSPSTLQVEATVANGPLSRYGWIEQCTDISLVPQDGTPPYILTVAPSLHPPYNITGDGSKPLNWTVSLSWSSSFFISVVDSAGRMWSNGLLHSGGGPMTACLAGMSPDNGASTGTVVGAGLGGLGVGIIAGLFGAGFFYYFRNKNRKQIKPLSDFGGNSQPGSPQGAYLHAPSLTSHYQALPNSAGVVENSLGLSTQQTSFGNRINNTPTHYQIEPFLLSPATEPNRQRSPSSPTHNPSNPSLNAPSSFPESGVQPMSPQNSQPLQNQVYVVHHDGGRAPVTVYTQEGTQVVELPPGYPGGGGESSTRPLQNPHSYTGHDARSAAASSTGFASQSSDAAGSDIAGGPSVPISLQQVRRPGEIQKKRTKRPVTRE